jgi:hypothetical protein
MLHPDYPLLGQLLESASEQAELLLSKHAVMSPALQRLKSDLELSPLLDKQLTATALQVAVDRCLTGGIRASVLNRFRAPAPGVAAHAQRRAVEAEVLQRGLPMELASDYSNTLEVRLAAAPHERPEVLWNYASLYGELWSDPRLGARAATRRIMLAMATTLRARSAQLSAARVSENETPHRAACRLPTIPADGVAS